MEIEQIEVLAFLKQHPPFNELPEETLSWVATQVEISYFKAGSPILVFEQAIDSLHLVRSGAVEVFRRNGDLYNRLSEGGLFGQFGLLRHGKVRFPAQALEDTLVYLIPVAVFNQLFEEHETFADAVEVEDRTRLRQAISRHEDANQLLSARVGTLINRELITLDKNASIQDAALHMTELRVSCLLITEANTLKPAGILTDKDLRIRVLATGADVNLPVSEFMTTELLTIEHNQMVFEAMLMMLRFNVHHLPVMKQGKPFGVIAVSDIIRYESQNSLFVVGSIFRQTSPEDLAALVPDVRASFIRMVNEDANSHMIGSAMAVIGRSFKQHLLELAEAELGPPPIPYCFLALGSMARDEQSLVTDQDNALILHDSFEPALHDEYFKKLATIVSDGLAACGYTYCTGDIMATNSRWRQPYKVWQQYFTDWIEKPTPESLLHSSIFFDLDGVWGKVEWADQLNDRILRLTKRHPRFLACMARNALNRTPPLGFFKNFVMETDGKHNNSINMKRRGTAPVADLIRVHALAIGSKAKNSFDRLEDIIAANILPKGRGQDLRDALELISIVRIRHQAKAVELGEEPDNNVAPENLSDFERNNLKDAFQILSHAQKFLRFRYPMH
ncbi:MAG TPA: DUF294 nucleotidyltransferase-like domain-containing protein [Marinospirillum sp.]|uniref:putative nucleotidyltransferase substrate binding domain-containing protein n=1 Tax=Marinospirillum sp. TaxID=2183934 RepID=UPI002B45AAA0|nr:DUF294 nucleotidyltransferase-like domain-containing protein [Marinospirillum sp.]HKM14304.1 DUF294 nucleotidyltransferase-like domain-containing protein [Marinospirillum sp.]